MMNNSFNVTSHQHQNFLNNVQLKQQQHSASNIGVTTSNANIMQSPPSAAALGYVQQATPMSNHQPQHQGSAVLGSAHNGNSNYIDTRQLHPTTTIGLDRNSYYTSAATAAAAPGRFYTTNSVASVANAHPSTILITNNFAQQQQPQTQLATTQPLSSIGNVANSTGYNSNSLRIVSSTSPQAISHPQHGCNINNNSLSKDGQHLQVADVLQVQQLPATTQQVYQQQQNLYQPPPHCLATHQQHLPTALLTQHFAQQQFAATQSHGMHLQLSPPQHFYVPATTTDASAVVNGATTKLLPTTVVTDVGTTLSLPHSLSAATATAVEAATAASDIALPKTSTAVVAPPNSSTVVLDRINICINNHYTDATSSTLTAGGGISSSSSAINSLSTADTSAQQQPSPIIPAIQHKAVIDTSSGLFIDPYASNESTTLVIDEPDSTTTTPHTPPTTPENNSPTSTTSNDIAPTTAVQSPSTSTTTANTVIKNKSCTATLSPATSPISVKRSFASVAIDIEDDVVDEIVARVNEGNSTVPAKAETVKQQQPLQAQLHQLKHKPTVLEVVQLVQPITVTTPALVLASQTLTANSAVTAALTTAPLTPPTPPSPALPSLAPELPPQSPSFCIGEDVFIQRLDGRFYLGTVMDTSDGGGGAKFLVRFDDKSEQWCTHSEMRKLGASKEGSNNGQEQGQMCVTCKRTQIGQVVETCERCGRGYHRSCTTETTPGSGVWLCKRCGKSMKVLKESKIENTKGVGTICRQLPYHLNALNWDDKHRVNEEQIYCYCGGNGNFDQDMLQCCKCCNWFHTYCMQSFKEPLLRGDGFFVFCCTLCNDGVEFLRRLQMNWVDLLHLILYNLSSIKKQHKYHHLIKDIWPFALEKRSTLPIPKEWIEMPEKKLMEALKQALMDDVDRFISGRENKKGHYYFALRTNGPPILPKVNVMPDDLLSDEFLENTLKLTLFQSAENESVTSTMKGNTVAKSISSQKDIYEFCIEEDDTSEDEIPIKEIIEKVRKSKSISTNPAVPLSNHENCSSHLEAIDVQDENANDANSNSLRRSPSISPPKVEGKHSPKKRDTKVAGLEAAKSMTQVNGTSTATNSLTTTTVQQNEKSSRKRKAFTLSNSYKEIAAEAASKRYDSNRICDSSSDENSSSSRGTSLDWIIPPPKNFLGLNNPFRMVSPKKHTQAHNGTGTGSGVNRKTVSFSRCGTMVKSSIFNTTTLDFSSKLAALKRVGIFPNISTSDLAKAAGQPRTVRTIKRRLSAKDITIGPNQEVRRRRTRNLSSNVEVISTTTINTIPSNFFPIHAKDLLTFSTCSAIPNNANTTAITTFISNRKITPAPPTFTSLSSASSASSSPPASTTSSLDSMPATQAGNAKNLKPTHGRHLRQRPQKVSPANSRRSSISGASTSSNSSVALVATTAGAAATDTNLIMQDLKQSVNKYFGAANRIESGELFSICGKRQLANGQNQYLIEWGEAATAASQNNAIGSTDKN